MFKKLSAPIGIQWEVTPECNFSCVHCYNYWRKDGGKKGLDIGKMKEYYLASVTEIIRNGIFSVTVTGGEPLLVFEEILPYIVMLRDAGVEISFNSNLSLLTEEMVKVLSNVGVRSILVSLPSGIGETNDHITHGKNSRDKTARGIRLALGAGIRVAANMVVTKINLMDIFETANFVKKIGVKSFSATRAATPGNCKDFSSYRLSLEEFRLMLNELVRVREELGLLIDSLEFYPNCSFGDDVIMGVFGSKRSCTAAKTNCTIGFDGQIRPCSHAPQTYGSVFAGFRKAWDSMDEWRQNIWIPDECQSCSLRSRCGGGCKIEALLVNGSMSRPDPYCDFVTVPFKPQNRQKSKILFNPQKCFRFNSEIRFREESFGGLLYVSASNWVPVVVKLLRFVQKKKGGDINVQDLMVDLGVDFEEAVLVVNRLMAKKIVLQGD